MKWIALFSKTGTELYEIIKNINLLPDLIITNQKISNLNNEYRKLFGDKLIEINEKISIEDYEKYFVLDSIITLHGWMKIIPREICLKYDIYNGHPGLITKYPQLKGKDPQLKAYKLKLLESGSVIHRVTPTIDSGEIISFKSIQINELCLDDVIKKLHNNSIELWINFLKNKLYI